MLRRCLLLGLLLVALAVTCHGAGRPDAGVVTWLDDGDSFRLAGGETVRLIGIDCPEREDGPRDRFYRDHFGIAPATLRQAGRQALHLGIREIKGQRLRLEYDATARDSHGRLLAYAYLPDGRMLNRLLLERGLAAVFRKYDFARKQEFLAVEAEARQAQRGMWRR